VLKAFSGQLYGEWTVPGWSPPLCGLTHSHPHYIATHARIKMLVEAAVRETAVVEALGVEVRQEEEAWDGRIDTLATRLREERNIRRARRKRAQVQAKMEAVMEASSEVDGKSGGAASESDAGLNTRARAAVDGGVADLAALEILLAEESCKGKRELTALREGRAAAVAFPAAALAAALDERNRLRDQHRSMSHDLLGEIFASYRLPNFRGGSGGGGGGGGGVGRGGGEAGEAGLSGATLRESFVSENEEALLQETASSSRIAVPTTAATEVNLPCGCGDCCAPKLLAECARLGLRPIAIAEVWMGVPARQEGDRQEGGFYGACRGRCRPILGHMLCGAESETELELENVRGGLSFCRPRLISFHQETGAL